MRNRQHWVDEFPILGQTLNGRPLAYLDSAATTQRPEAVTQAVTRFNRESNANVHRGVHTLSQLATEAFEQSRASIGQFIGATDPHEIVFTKGCTESLNLVAASWGGANLAPGDEILVSTLEHHSNIVPWQIVAEKTGAIVRPIPVSDDCVLDLEALRNMLSGKTKVLAVKHVCNASGTVNPIKEICGLARNAGAVTVIDGAQALAHVPVDVKDLDCDFYAFTAHKVYGPFGAGALYGRSELLNAMPPYQTGGGMIRTVSFGGSTYTTVPEKFEPGTPHVSGAIGFAAALEWFDGLGKQGLWSEEAELLEFATAEIQQIPGVRIVGNSPNKVAVLSFVTDFAHPHDIGTVLDSYGVAVRAGHHCCMPLMDRLGIPGTVRASLGVYNTKEDISVMIEGLCQARRMFA